MTEVAIADVPSRDIITSLPFELLQEIFMIVRDWEIAGVCAGQWNVTAPERLSAVSSSWRQVAFQIPILWNTIQFHRYADPTWLNVHLSERHQRHLQLSKDLPLDIIISSTAQIPTPVYPFSIFPMGRLNLIAKRDGTDTTMRSVVQGININMAVDVETLLRDIIQVDLGNVTHFKMGNVSLAQIYNSTNGRIFQSHTFQSVLDALPVIESQLPQLSQLHILTTSKYNAESTMQFTQLFNMNATTISYRIAATADRRAPNLLTFTPSNPHLLCLLFGKDDSKLTICWFHFRHFTFVIAYRRKPASMAELDIVGVATRDFVTRLPVELLQEIFMIVRDREIAGVCAGQWNITAPERLCAVSSSWRQVVFTMPLLWNTVQFNGYADPTWLNIRLSERHHRHLELSKDLPIDIIISTTQILTLAAYPFCIFPMDKVRHVFIRHHSSIRTGSLLENIEGTTNLLRELRTKFHKIDSIDLYMLGRSKPGTSPQILQLNIVTKQGQTTTVVRSVVQKVDINMVADVNMLLYEVNNLDLDHVTHFKVANVQLVRNHYVLEAFMILGPSLRHLELGPLSWQLVSWEQVLSNLPRLECLKLYQNTRIQIYGLKSGQLFPSRAFQPVLDTLPAIESQLPQLSRLRLSTTSKYNAESTIQFIQLFNMNTSRGDKRLDLEVSRKTFEDTEFVVLDGMHDHKLPRMTKLAIAGATRRNFISCLPVKILQEIFILINGDTEHANIGLSELHRRHLELSKDLPIDIIVVTSKNIPNSAGYPFCVLSMDQIRHITIRHYSTLMSGFLAGDIVDTVSLLRELSNTFPQINSIDLYVLGKPTNDPEDPLQVIQISLVTKQGRTETELRPVIQAIHISMVYDLNIIFSQLRILNLSNVTRFEATNVQWSSEQYWILIFIRLGSSLKQLELGPWRWLRFPSELVLAYLPRLESLKLHHRSRAKCYNYNKDNLPDDPAFQAVLDTLPAVETQLPQLSHLYLSTTPRHSAESIIQFVRLYNTNAVREGKRLELTVTRRTFEEVDFVELGSLARLVVVD
ncbi:hypothetical protein M408DRAFT_323979 [Serendipita vermifera MAFF 305830]|uniref:Uncharacterized protein n=1 Tax=Serendipita vermifera MAFF 305830 TaxID=933852 RepID=A0A0C2WY16_SERVB|nr:hypothetical protein M408DRAFT_323979 [Serendipita vermifera MAFF 305830]